MIITANTSLEIEEEFKIEAGPGAGKTTFLVNHINNVISKSQRLYMMRKIACITFTNTAVETIKERLGEGALAKTEISTIHSFLYNNILKPYGSFIPNEYGVCIEKVEGHEEPFVNGKYVNQWLSDNEFVELKHPNTKNQLLYFPEKRKALKKWLLSAKCGINNGIIEWYLEDEKAIEEGVGINKKSLKILKRQFLNYKKLYWEKGKLDYEDTLFFSGILIQKYPFILTVLRAKYPYFFVDEFQDTNPIQEYIISEIKKEESVVGVIGDKAQSIYGFQGAKMELFNRYKVKNIYSIVENHRSDKRIVNFLNVLRNDLEQKFCEEYDDALIKLYVGKQSVSFQQAKKVCGEEIIVSLSRDNITSNIMKNNFENDDYNKKILKEIEDCDSNYDRRNYIISFIYAIELVRNFKIKEALKKIEWLYRMEKEPKKIALKMLNILMKNYSDFSNENLMRFYMLLRENENYILLTDLKKGKAKNFYENTLYIKLAVCVNIVEDASNHITIHKAKGAEYDNVFVVGNKDFLKFLLSPQINENEEHRIYYVALSRAKKRLFLCLDDLKEEEEKILLHKYSMDIERI